MLLQGLLGDIGDEDMAEQPECEEDDDEEEEMNLDDDVYNEPMVILLNSVTVVTVSF